MSASDWIHALEHPARTAHRRQRRRAIASALVSRAAALPDDDRDLILAVYADGRSILSIARRDEDDPERIRLRAAAIARRVRGLSRRMLHPAFDAVVLHAHAWPPAMRRVGHACFVLGLSMRRAAKQPGLSLHALRTHAQPTRALAAAIAVARRADTAA